MILKIDPERINAKKCGITVKAQNGVGDWEPIDLAHLERKSLQLWLRSAGGENRTAEDVVGILLGYGHLWP